METLFNDIRYGVRSLLKQPGFTVVAVITLALGMGVNTAIFSLVHAVLLRPLPFPDSDWLVVVKDQNGKTGETFPAVSPADFFDWKSQSQSFANLAAYSGWPLTLFEGERSEMIPATRVTDEFFNTLGVQPLLGRSFRPDEFKSGSAVVIPSHRLWQRSFGGDPNIITKTLAVEQGSFWRGDWSRQRPRADAAADEILVRRDRNGSADARRRCFIDCSCGSAGVLHPRATRNEGRSAGSA